MSKQDMARYRANLQAEQDSAYLYRALADCEADSRKKEIFEKLAAVEDAHAHIWIRNLQEKGYKVPAFHPTLRTRMMAFLARRFGPGFVLPALNANERNDSSLYDSQPEAVAEGLPQTERSHAAVLNALSGSNDRHIGSTIASFEGQHSNMGGNSLRAAVLGANDGLVSNLSLVMGMTGAAAGQTHIILLTGLAGLIAGACSMAMGEWLSVNSARELYHYQAEQEAQELKEKPEEELEELVLIYQAKGLAAEEARALATKLMSDSDTALDTLLREELGLDPNELGGSPWAAAGWSFGLFSLGAIFPVLPFALFSGSAAIIGSLIASVFALAVIGIGTSLFTGRSPAFSAARQIGIGLAAAAITYGIGAAAGVAIN